MNLDFEKIFENSEDMSKKDKMKNTNNTVPAKNSNRGRSRQFSKFITMINFLSTLLLFSKVFHTVWFKIDFLLLGTSRTSYITTHACDIKKSSEFDFLKLH